MPDTRRDDLARAHKGLVALATLCVVLGALLAWALQRPAAAGPSPAPRSGSDATAEDPAEALRRAQEHLFASGGLFDSHADADVSRVLLPGLVDFPSGGDRVSSNRFGLREREFLVPKPPDLLRVVLLGDSFVYGMGIPADARLGVHLERRLTELAGAGLRIQVLHVGITSWGLLAQEAYLRRKLALFQPDLVIHHVVPNDLDDTSGVRGNGAPGRLAPARPQQADVLVSSTHGRWALDPAARSLLPWGQDGESRARFREASAAVTRLAQAVTGAGARYVLVVNWHSFSSAAATWLAPAAPAGQVAWLPSGFYRDPAFRISEADEHWSAAGHERVGEYLLGLVLERGLLPAASLSDDVGARASFTQMDRAGAAEATQQGRLEEQVARQPVASRLDLSTMTAGSAAQVYAGVDRDGLVGPYASLVLSTAGGTRLVLSGRGLPRPELDGAEVAVFVDDDLVGTLALRAGAPLALSVGLPDAARARRWVAVRFRADDFVHAGEDLRHTVTFELERVAIE